MCTTICFNKENQVIVGNNKDTFIPTGMLFTNHRNIQKKALLFPPENPFKWVSKYGSLTFCQFGKEFPSCGINEHGFVVEHSILPESIYPNQDEREALKELQWIQVVLDTCKTIDDAVQLAKNIRISQAIWPVHFFICDGTGNFRILEYLKGDLHIFGNGKDQIPILTNSSYHDSINCINGRESMIEIEDPYRYNSIDTFQKATKLVSKVNDFTSSPENTGFNILSQVSTPETLWGFVYNASNPSLHLKDNVNKSKFTLSLKEIDFSSDAPWKLMEIWSKRDILSESTLQDYSFNMNNKLVKSFFHNQGIRNIIGYHVPEEGIMNYSIYPEQLSKLEE